MTQNSSHPEIVPPLPPAVKAIVLAFTAGMTLFMIAFIGLLSVDFVAEIIGHPLRFIELESFDDDSLPTERDEVEKLNRPFELITPQDQTQIQGPEVVVIYTVREKSESPPSLRINDVLHLWEIQYGSNTWFARLQLPAGVHHLQAGEAEAEFFVNMPDSTKRLPELWLLNRPHPSTNDADRCVDCHEMSSRRETIGAWLGASSCFTCHDEDAHRNAHRLILPTTDRGIQCARCHTIH